MQIRWSSETREDTAKTTRVNSSTESSSHTEDRNAAVEAAQIDYRAVLAAVNALGAERRDHSLRLDALPN